MSQLQVFLNFNFIDLQQLYQTDPESQKQRYEQFYSNWILYIQGNNQILRQINPEVYQLMSGEIQVQIPTAIQQLTEDVTNSKNARIVELERKINNTIIKQQTSISQPLGPPAAQSHHFSPLKSTQFLLPHYEEIPLAATQPPIFPIPRLQVSQLFDIANSIPSTIPAPPQISLQNFTKTQFSTLTDQMQSLSLMNNSMSNSIVSHDFKMVISEPQQGPHLGKRVIQEDSDAGQNLLAALGGMDEVSMCLMQLGLQERSESRQ
ncbi:hypothetical protein SS50377_27991 [Spironucleus salmonicida]|nr:hypothetical protein SS50377_27991 [Spironucleus salmonicida]